MSVPKRMLIKFEEPLLSHLDNLLIIILFLAQTIQDWI